MDKLKSLASSKIHCVNSTAKGEITYARYIYQYTNKEDTTVRAPVANFWATRSHTLRAEAEDEFRSLCLEFPQFGYDVLSKFPSCLDTCTREIVTLTHFSSRVGREAQARAEREAASGNRERTQASPPQQRIVVLLSLIVAIRPFISVETALESREYSRLRGRSNLPASLYYRISLKGGLKLGPFSMFAFSRPCARLWCLQTRWEKDGILYNNKIYYKRHKNS